MKVIGRGMSSNGERGAVGVLGVLRTKLGPTDGADDTAMGVEDVGIAEVDVRLVVGGTEPCDRLH